MDPQDKNRPTNEQRLINYYRSMLTNLKNRDPHSSVELMDKQSGGGQQRPLYYDNRDKIGSPQQIQQQQQQQNSDVDQLTDSTSLMEAINDLGPNETPLLKQQQQQESSPSSSPPMFIKAEPQSSMEREQQNRIELSNVGGSQYADNETMRRLRLAKLAKYLKSTSGHLLAPMLYAQALQQQRQDKQQRDLANANYDGPTETITDNTNLQQQQQGTWSSDGGEDAFVIPSSVSADSSSDSRYNMYRLFGGPDKKNELSSAGVRSPLNITRKRALAGLMNASPMAHKRGQAHHASTSNYDSSGNRESDDDRDHNQAQRVEPVQAWSRYLLKAPLGSIQSSQMTSSKFNDNSNSDNNDQTKPKESKYFNPEQDGRENSNELTTIPQSINSMYEQRINEEINGDDSVDNNNNRSLLKDKSTNDYIQRVINDKWNILKHLNYNNNNNKIENLRFQDVAFKRFAKDKRIVDSGIRTVMKRQQTYPAHTDIARALVM